MSRNQITPQNLPETLVWYYIICTYPIYLLGAQYVFAPILASYLVFYLLRKWWNQTEETPPNKKITISPLIWVWVVAVLVIEFALIIGHLNFNLGIVQILKSSLNWYRSWGLFALFPLVGHLNIRPRLIYRAICILCLQSLIVVLIGSLAAILKIPIVSYSSPLINLFGGVRLSYSVNLFYIYDEGEFRLNLFAPWAPILGMMGNIYFYIALHEASRKWRLTAMAGAVSMIFASVSRTGMLCFPLVLVLPWLLTNFLRPWVQFTLGFMSMLLGMIAPTLINLLQSVKDDILDARAGSSKVRDVLYRLAIEKWWKEAPIWGHGRLEEHGPAFAAHLPIGSHHTWFGILYSHGIVGFVSLAVAFSCSVIYLLIKAPNNTYAQMGLIILVIILLFSFAENIEGSAYTYWPALLFLGIAYKESSSSDEKFSVKNIKTNC